MRDLTKEIKNALSEHKCRVISHSSVFLTDRPENVGKEGSKSGRGNSDVEAGHSFDLAEIVQVLGDFKSAKLSLNNIRIFGRIDDRDYPHYHGYSWSQLTASKGRFHFIFMTVQSVATYDVVGGGVFIGAGRREIEVDGFPGLILIHDEDGILVKQSLRVGDSIILPSGVYHTFAAIEGIFASYGAVEVCNDPDFMYQVHYEENERDPRETVANTIEHLTGRRPPDVSTLTLADVPGLERYVERRLAGAGRIEGIAPQRRP